jgi:hypothetical protein
VLFTFPSRYLCTIGRRGVFSLGSWSTQIPTGFHVSRGTREPCQGDTEPFAYGAFTLYGGSFQRPSARLVFSNSPDRPQPIQAKPLNPAQATPAGLAPARFGLFRVRSPLLTESLLFSLPGGTEMVHFPPFASTELCICSAMTGHDPGRVSPFGNPRITACLRLPEAYRSLPRPSSPLCAKASTVYP